MPVDIVELTNNLQQANARWSAGETHLTALPIDQLRMRLGVVLDEPARAQLAQAMAQPPTVAAPQFAAAVDWRNNNGNHVPPVEDQGQCGSCVSFCTCALVSSMCSIEQGQMVDLSEADLHFCSDHGPNCGGWWPQSALQSVQTRGVAPEDCFPYATAGVPSPHCAPCGDRDRRAVKITRFGSLAAVGDRKNYLSSTGPCSGVLHVFEDFFAYRTGTYHHISGTDVGLHCVEIIGYSEAEQCWICKNSWGTGWGDSGFFKIAYGECGIDAEFPFWTAGGVQIPARLVSPRVPALAQINPVSRSADKLDIFVSDSASAIETAAWEPAFPDWWHGWWSLNGGRAAPGAPVHGVSRSTDKLDVFVVGTDNFIYTAAWEPAFADGWHGWWRLNNGVAAPGAHVTAVSRSVDKLDVFVVGTDGRIWTAAWEPSFRDGWHGWWPIGNLVAPQGAYVGAVSRGPDKLDIFVTDVNGAIQTAAWEPAFSDGWHGWWMLNGGRAAPGAPVTPVSRNRDKLDVFVVGTDGRIWTAAWEPSFRDGWHGWWPIGAALAAHGTYVGAVSRSADKLDIFVTDTSGAVQTAAWEPAFSDGWHGWWGLNGGRGAQGAPVTPVSRNTDKLDVFVVGTDNRVWTAAWEPTFSDGWHGWWPIGV